MKGEAASVTTASAPATGPSPVPAGTGELVYPAAGVQTRFWLLHELYPEAPLCNEGIALRMRGELDVAALRRALDAIVARHESLRASFQQATGGVMVQVAHQAAVPFEEVDLQAADPDSRPRLLEGIARGACSARFDLAAPPLMRATLVREAPDCHVLLLVFHHIIADGTSFLKLFPAELALLYPALRGQRPAPALPPVASYREFVQGSLSQEQRARVAEDLVYWQQALAGAPPYLPLPTDHPHPARASGKGVRLEARLPAAVRQQVQQLAERLGVRPFDVTAAAFVALLGRYSDEDEVVVGTPIANRGPAFKHTIGCFINALVLRTPLRADQRFQELIVELGRIRREARGHAQIPFGELIDHLGAGRDGSRNAIYQVMFNYLDFSLDQLRIDGLQVEGWRASAGTAMLDLSLDVTEQPDGGYLLCLEASTDLFEVDHAGRMLEHYRGLLQAGLAVPEGNIWELAYIPAAEQARIAAFARGPALPPMAPEDQLPFHELVARRARAWGDRLALRSEQRALSYDQLVAAVQAVGQGLRRQGVVDGELVLVGAGDDPCDTLTMILGVMAAGAAYVPLDPASPAARQQAVQADCGARWLLVGAGFDDRWRPPGLRVLAFDPGRPGWPDAVPEPAAGQLSRLPLAPMERPAYLMYTSGSTGTPKGVLVSQRNLLHQCRARLQRYDDAPGILLGTYSFAFDSSLAGISHTLCAGGTLRFAGERLRRDPVGLRQLIAAEGITHLDMVPSAYAAVLADAAPAQLASLRVVVCGGEALPPELARRHFQLAPAARLYNEYGPTEATVFATVHELAAAALPAGRPPIGTPVGDTSCWLLDARGQLVPLGHAGELHIGGGGVALGYHGRPADNARAFVTRCPEGGGEQRMYRTGDQARLGSDGTLDMIGRRDDQVQLRGHRVELGEVEAMLRQAPGVKDAAVVLRADPGTPAQLVGYYVLGEAASASAASIRKQLSARLPSYMVPAVLMPVPALRRTARGKLDRESLPRPQPGANGAAVHEPPRTATEQRLAELWQRLLGKDRIGRADDFFALGGHSLLAVKLVDAIERELSARLRLADIFQSPTLEGMAAALADQQSAEPTAHARWRCLEEIHDEGEGLPLFFLGSTAQARSIAVHLGEERPVYGLNIFGLHQTGQPAPHLDIPDLARQYLEEIRAVRPHGPYCLAGYCEDAKVAMEVGWQLQAAGEQVGTLLLIDAVWFLQRLQPVKVDERFGRARKLARNVQRFGLDFVRHRLERRRRYAREDLRLLLCEVETRVRRLLGAAAPLQLEHRVLITRYYEALGRYQAPDYQGSIHLYVAEEWGLHPGDRLAGGLAVQPIAGYHDQILEGEGLLELASHMRRALAEADRSARAAPSPARPSAQTG